MTPDTLAAVGLYLYGHRWRREMSEALAVHRVTVNRWADGECQMPEDLPRRLADLAQARQYAAREAERLARQAG